MRAGREDGLVFAVAVCTGLHKGGMNEELANENCLAAATRYKTWRSAFCSTAALCSTLQHPAALLHDSAVKSCRLIDQLGTGSSLEQRLGN